MRVFRGKFTNKKKNFLGIIISSEKNNYIAENLKGDVFYIGKDGESFDYTLLESKDILNVGDIVKISSNGELIVLFEKSSIDNALFLTDKCNNACVMCPQPLKKEKNSYLMENLAILSLLNESPEVIGITGGEPTEEWNELLELLSLLASKHPNTEVQLLTNGRIFSDINKVEEIVNSNKNILFCVPLYSELPILHNEIVGNNNAYYETINGLYNLAKFKQPIELRTVVMRMNYFRLPEWANWICMNLPFISHVAIMGLELTNNAFKNYQNIWIDPVDYKKELFCTVKVFRRHDIPCFIYNHQLCTVNKEIWNNCCKSISDFKVIYLKECNDCKLRDICGGFFNSTKNKHSVGIKAIGEG